MRSINFPSASLQSVQTGERVTVREDRELILVRAPAWSAGEPEVWLAPRLRTGWISTVRRRLLPD